MSAVETPGRCAAPKTLAPDDQVQRRRQKDVRICREVLGEITGVRLPVVPANAVVLRDDDERYPSLIDDGWEVTARSAGLLTVL
jgi:hypothetical protein